MTKQTEVATQNAKSQVSVINQFSAPDIDIIKNSVAKGTTDAELNYFLAVAASNKLNPFNKEIWCYKSGSDLLIFAGRDGLQANAQRQHDFAGLRSAAVYENDKFEMDIPAGHVSHKFGPVGRGRIVGAYAICKRKNIEPFVVWADIDTYDKKRNTWETHKAAMIEKVAEAHALKKAYPLGAISVAEDFDFDRGKFGSAATLDTDYTVIDEPKPVTRDEAMLSAIENASDIDALTGYFNDNPEYHSADWFVKALGAKKQALKKAEKEAKS